MRMLSPGTALVEFVGSFVWWSGEISAHEICQRHRGWRREHRENRDRMNSHLYSNR